MIEIPGIHTDEQGVAWIEGTTTKVVEVVQDVQAGLLPEEIHKEHPNWTLAQILAAIQYYNNHKEEINADIERREQLAEKMRLQATGRISPDEFRRRTRQQKRRMHG
ncbi:MAG TPA: DUF433 domain-containing protein [Chthonomonadaceae bacterium]|nr:DUF433 domain-containing protein [Chthonomonadaceae bacterium]